ncbi:glycosyltransferase [Bradyrhizobium diazoefficiens]|nr:glycosyltransferase family 4 protein [Bradyrhizobium diazoefficiens]UCF50849.1 MAG: glycosyltransferase [Bradyrhizobium sp.]MBR0963347.1 glycosyltransferase [Bradyrhizobium diazoefficiens]MBR0976161.1 glycosyltransferase [Bradyrhizobium diazoefficiens]MBR1007009.1 glycosyltransferase [Bradyrhizobium diazoefficiens]MBR1013120.1 glycosyltransferase [Bradyrhizobium diazoefficiens]
MSPALPRKKLLFISPVMPAEEGNGLAMRVGFFLEAYSRHFDIDLVVVPVAGQAAEVTSFVTARCVRHVIIAPRAGSHFGLVARLRDPQARLDAFRHYGQPSLAAGITEPILEELRSWIGAARYAVVHLSRLYLAALSRAVGSRSDGTRLILDCDENDIATQQSIGLMHRRRGSVLQAEWASCEADAFRTLARQSLAQFDVLFAASRGDCASLACEAGHERVLVVPNVVTAQARRRAVAVRQRARTVLFVGTLGYEPNADAVEWFVSRVWPGLVRGLPDGLRLVIAGGGASARLGRLSTRRGILVTGPVPEIAPLYAGAALAIAPLRAGGGTRIKLLEAAAHGVPSVSTRLGAAGLRFRNGRDILLADGAEQFGAACHAILTEGALARRIADNARNRVRSDYDRARWAGVVGNFAIQMAAGSLAPAASNLRFEELMNG